MPQDDDIFADALDLPVSERASFLDRACAGDPARRVRVEALLAGHGAAEGFLERSLIARPVLPGEPAAGDILGHYTLVRPLGEGGCGVVWLAEQAEPLRRQVALKIIKLGMDTRSVVARFEAERQTLALMAHPDIAQVFDAGATAAGRPYFVMEYVEGVPITRYCDEQRLPLLERLELFNRVCLALQHAHQKGIIHRDLKPSNILVTRRDGVPAPKIIDFGIAKATQGRLAEHTLLTELGQFIGTPAYMSPEQAQAGDHDIDTRSDVYSLGVLLYELLTGRPPYDPKSLVQAGVLEIRRIIREVDPPRPSTALSTLTHADRDTIARQRGSAPVQLSSVLRGDLDWIVMRCLEKNRDRRYGTASELAEDIRRHLSREPVHARPPSALYRLQRFVARHRVACVSGALVALALVAGTVVSVRQAIRATRAEHLAAAERDAARQAQRAEAVARNDARRRQEQAEDLLTFMLGDFRTELKKIGQLSLLDTVGAKAFDYFNALDPRDLTDAALTRQAKGLTQIGEVRLEQARYSDASAAFLTAHQRASELAARHPNNSDMLFERAQAEFWIGFVGLRRGDTATTYEWFKRYRDSALALVTLEGSRGRALLELIYGHHNLAVVEVDRGNLAEAERGFLAERDALDHLLPTRAGDSQLQFNRADVASWLGTVAERRGQLQAAADYYAEMTERYSALREREPHVARWKLELAQGLTFRGLIAAMTGKHLHAGNLLAESAVWHDALAVQDPKNKQWLAAQQSQRLHRASLLLAGDTPAAAASLIAEARSHFEALVAAEPTSFNYRRSLTGAWRLEAQRLLAAGAAEEARAAVTGMMENNEPLRLEAPGNVLVLSDLAHVHLLSGRVAQIRQDADTARAEWERALSVLASRLPDASDWRVLEPAALALQLLNRSAEARPLILRLQGFGFEPIDPWARSVLGLGPLPRTAQP